MIYEKFSGLCNAVNAPLACLLFNKVLIYCDTNSKSVQSILREYDADNISFMFRAAARSMSDSVQIRTIDFMSQPANTGLRYCNDFSISERRNFLANNINEFMHARRKQGEVVIPLSEVSFVAEDKYSMAENIGYNACIGNFDLIDREKLDWEQVREIRMDDQSRAAIARLRNWIHAGFDAKSREQALDIIELNISDYREAIRKHGVETRLGAFRSLLDWQTIGILAGANTLSQLMDHDFFGYLFSGAYALGNTLLSIHETNLRGHFRNRLDQLGHIEHLVQIEDTIETLDGRCVESKPEYIFGDQDSQKRFELWQRKQISELTF